MNKKNNFEVTGLTHKEWLVKSNSFKEDYIITGDSLVNALVENFDIIEHDIYMNAKFQRKLLKIDYVYVPTILNGKGGFEIKLTIQTKSNDVINEIKVIWAKQYIKK